MQTPTKNRRVTKEGCFFSGLRVTGLVLKILGGLALLGGIIGFIISFIRSAPVLSSSIQALDQQMGGFVFTLIMVWLVAFMAVGCTGLVMIAIGFGLDFAATEPATTVRQHPIDKPLSPA